MGSSGTLAQRRHMRPVLTFAVLVSCGCFARRPGPHGGRSRSRSRHLLRSGIVNGPGEEDASPVELGVRFTVSTSGSVVALRFYKTSKNVGKHTGSLWSSSGTRLARVTFTNETASGWQIARLSKPVAILAGRTYVASYHTDTGHYAQLEGAFAGGATLGNSTMRATAGVYRYGSSGYPRRTWHSSAYFVDALFVPSNTPSATSDGLRNPTSRSLRKSHSLHKSRSLHESPNLVAIDDAIHNVTNNRHADQPTDWSPAAAMRE